MPTHDETILRELAAQYSDIAADPVNAARKARIRRINGLKPERPPVWIDEIPWHEMDIDGQLALRCEDPFAREMETYFRRILFRRKYFPADMVVEPYYAVYKAYDSTGIGMETIEETVALDGRNHIVSHAYEDQLDTEEKLASLQAPVFTARPDRTAERMERAEALLGGTLPVRALGHGIYHAPWDVIPRLRGVEPILFDMVDRPEFLHQIIAKFTAFGISQYKQMEAQNLLEVDIPSLHCTPPYTDELPAEGFDGEHVRLKDVWFRGMAQMFSSVSPDMHNEFDIEYMRPLMDRCGLSYYGCCEPLDRVIPYLKKVPNLRKIGVSPWADIQSSAEQIGGDYVFARKPNPALVAGTLDEDAVRWETRETVDACLANGCPYELVLKDISTVAYKPENLIRWHDTVMDVLDEVYGR